MRIPLTILGVLFCYFAGIATGAATEVTSSTRPNVIIIYTDDMGYADISSFANKPLKVKTPNIDRLAKDGMKFTQFYVGSPICSPSRAALLSGRFAPETQITTFLQTRDGNRKADQNDFLDPALAHMPLSFQAGGYATAHVGKWHLGGGRDVDNAPSIAEYGYDEFYSTWESPKPDPKLGSKVPSWNGNKPASQLERTSTTAYMVDKTLDFLDRNSDKPCFITLWPEDLHTPFQPSQDLLKKYGGGPTRDRSFENFLGVLEEYDTQMGRLLDGLANRELAANTIVIFTGDNGPNPDFEGVRSDGLRGKKGTLYEGGIRIPFIVRWPGQIPAGRVNETILGAVDLLPTLTNLAGIPLSESAKTSCDGQDMTLAFRGESLTRNKSLMFEFGRTRPANPKGKADRGPQLAIIEGKYKLMVNRDGSDQRLFDLSSDRSEKLNIADKESSITKTMSKEVLNWSKTLPSRTHKPRNRN